MARKKQPVVSYVMFDVVYQDGTRSSHRKVPAAEPHEHDYEARVRATIEAQDREIAEKSGPLDTSWAAGLDNIGLSAQDAVAVEAQAWILRELAVHDP